MSSTEDLYAEEELRKLLMTIAFGEVFTMRSAGDITIGRRMRTKLSELREHLGIHASVDHHVELLISGTWAASGKYDLGNPGARKCALDALVTLDAQTNQESKP